jgi:hypothetical protein
MIKKLEISNARRFKSSKADGDEVMRAFEI